jgi:sterol O-acyltransferase
MTSPILAAETSTKSSAEVASYPTGLDPEPPSPVSSSAATLSQPRQISSAFPNSNSARNRSSLDTTSDKDADNVLEMDPETTFRGTEEGKMKGGVTFDDTHNAADLSVHQGSLAVEARSDGSSLPHRGPKSRQEISMNSEKPSGKRPHSSLLEADDPELKELIRKKLQSEHEVGEGRKRSRFSDLVFTHRFTVFDRQNSESSPFRGFYTLFWLGTFFMLVKIGAKNWYRSGSVFGGNEILILMLQRDLLVLGLTDGVLCGSTAFCLLLQRLILAGYLSWDQQGWIIQNVSCH